MTYTADKEGQIYNAHGHPMKYWINPSGYYYLKTYSDGEARAQAVHRFVWEYYNEPIPPKIEHMCCKSKPASRYSALTVFAGSSINGYSS